MKKMLLFIALLSSGSWLVAAYRTKTPPSSPGKENREFVWINGSGEHLELFDSVSMQSMPGGSKKTLRPRPDSPVTVTAVMGTFLGGSSSRTFCSINPAIIGMNVIRNNEGRLDLEPIRAK